MADLHGKWILQLSRPLIKHNKWTNIQDWRIIAPLHTASAGYELKRSSHIIEHSGLSLLYFMAPWTRILIDKRCYCTSVMFVLCINKCHKFQSIFELCSSQMIRTLFLVKKQRRRLNWNVQMNNWAFTYCLLPRTLGQNTFGSLLDIKRCCNSKAQGIERQETKNLWGRVGKQSTWEAIECAILFMFCNIKPHPLPHAWTGGYGGNWGYSSKPAREHIFAKKRKHVQNDLGSRKTSQSEQTNKRGWSRKKEQGG